jgi:hypothetical protein
MADPDIEQLKELVRQNIALTQETNRMVRGMRNAGRLKSFAWWLFVVASIGVSVWSYFTFIAPRIEQIKNIYETNIAPLQGAQNSILGFLKNFNPATTTQTH